MEQYFFLLWLMLYAAGAAAIAILFAYSMRLRYFSVRKRLHRITKKFAYQKLTRFSNHKKKTSQSETYVRANILAIIKQFFGLPGFLSRSHLGRMLQFDSTALKEPYVASATQNTSTEIISEPCNMETSKGTILRGSLFFAGKNKGKSLPVIL